MSRLFTFPWCFPLNGWLHFWNACLIQFGKLQDIEFSIKFCSTLPDCCKRSNAVFSLQHRLGLPCQREVRCLAFSLDVSAPCVQLSVCVQFWPQIPLQSSSAPHSTPLRLSFPFRSVHRFRPFLPSSLVCAGPPTPPDSFVCSF